MHTSAETAPPRTDGAPAGGPPYGLVVMAASAGGLGAVDEVLTPEAIAPALLRLGLTGKVQPVRLAPSADRG